jgi:hypothetical protein
MEFSEETLIAWFAAHPSIKMLLLTVFGSVGAMARADFERFKEYQLGDPTMPFSWRVAGWKYFQGVVIGVVPFLTAAVWRILGG